MQKGLVSAIITTYNRIDDLKKAIESVRNQTYKNIEIIVVNDVSTDETKEYLDSLDYVIPIHNTTSHGCGGGRNLGIKIARGEYVAFLDDDDTWLQNKISLQVEELQQNDNAELCTCGLRVNYLKSKMSYDNYPNLTNLSYDKMLLRNQVGISSCILVKKEIFNEIGYYDESLPAREDYDFHIRVSKQYKITYVNEVLVDYAIHEDRTKQMNSGTKIFEKANDLIFKKYEDDYNKLSTVTLNKRKSIIYFQYSTIFINNHLQKDAFKFIIKAFNKDKKMMYLVVMSSYIFGVKGYILLKKMMSFLLKVKPSLKG